MKFKSIIAALVGCAVLLPALCVNAGANGVGVVRAAYAANGLAAGQTTRHKSRPKIKRGAVKKMNDKDKAATPRRLAVGAWGGQHMRLSVRADGADIEFDCAHGTIDGPLTLTPDGRFDVSGTFIREGGPVRIDIKPTGRPARYEGSLTGQQLTLKVTLTETAQDAGTFTLTRGSEGRLWKCR